MEPDVVSVVGRSTDQGMIKEAVLRLSPEYRRHLLKAQLLITAAVPDHNHNLEQMETLRRVMSSIL